MSVSQRITEVLKENGIKNNFIAEQLGVDPTTIGNFKKGKTSPSIDFLLLLKKQIPKLNLNWLITTQGDRYLNDPQSEEITETKKRLEQLELQMAEFKGKYFIDQEQFQYLLETLELVKTIKKEKEENDLKL